MKPIYAQIVTLGRVLRKLGFKRRAGNVMSLGPSDWVIYERQFDDRTLAVMLSKGIFVHRVRVAAPIGAMPWPDELFDTAVEMLAAMEKLRTCELPDRSDRPPPLWPLYSKPAIRRRPARSRNRHTHEYWYGKPPK